MRQLTGSLLVVLSAIGFGFMGLFGKAWNTERGVTVEMMLLLRFGIAGAALAIIMLARGLKWPRGGTLLALLGMGSVLYFGEAMLFFHASRHIPVPLVSLLLYIYPVIVTLFAWLFLKEKLTAARLVALALAIVGLILTIAPELGAADAAGTEIPHSLRETAGVRAGVPLSPWERAGVRAETDTNRTLGVILGIGCALVYSVYILVGGRFARAAGAIPASTIVICSTAFVLAPIALARGDALPPDGLAWAGVLGIALVSTVISITALLAGLQRIGPVQTSTLSTLEPVTTAIVGATLMSDPLSPLQMLGGALIIFAAIIIARAKAEPHALLPAENPVTELH